tara:strand:+ start:1008 stop:1115 length:108 start_codon:yes stop_codon:yes gene_type:complete
MRKEVIAFFVSIVRAFHLRIALDINVGLNELILFR